MTGVAAGLVCLGLICIAVLFLPARPDAPPHRLASVGCVVLAILLFAAAAGMFFGWIKAG